MNNEKLNNQQHQGEPQADRDDLLRDIQRCGLDAICIDGPSIRDRLDCVLPTIAEE